MSGDAGAIGGGAFDADRNGFSELANPQCQVVVSDCSGIELTVFEQNPVSVMTAAWWVSAWVSMPQ
ncbi:hypothetical protein [Rhodococcus qingshengii]|uniref:hypothetical protein n=1 Tax=Rhodococcus qingshengii TaxID=334542 RepID=UPI0035E05A4A